MKTIGIISCSEWEQQYQFDLLQVLPDLSQPHRGVGEHLRLLHLLVQDLREHHLEGHRDSRLLQVLLEHLRLLLLLGGLVDRLT